jgi:hypothetical protein
MKIWFMVLLAASIVFVALISAWGCGGGGGSGAGKIPGADDKHDNSQSDDDSASADCTAAIKAWCICGYSDGAAGFYCYDSTGQQHDYSDSASLAAAVCSGVCYDATGVACALKCFEQFSQFTDCGSFIECVECCQ